MLFTHPVELPDAEPTKIAAPAVSVDAMYLLALSDGNESWYGTEIDKTKYRIVLENETENSVYLKIVKNQSCKEAYFEAVGEENA